MRASPEAAGGSRQATLTATSPCCAQPGSALALLVELLGAALPGTDLGIEGGARSEAGGMNRGLLLIAIDPTRQAPEALRHAELLLSAMEAERGTRLPSAARYAARAAADKSGIPVEESLLVQCFGPT